MRTGKTAAGSRTKETTVRDTDASLRRRSTTVRDLKGCLRLRALESTASVQALEDAEDTAAAQDWLAGEARGETSYVPLPEVRHRLGLAD